MLTAEMVIPATMGIGRPAAQWGGTGERIPAVDGPVATAAGDHDARPNGLNCARLNGQSSALLRELIQR